MKGMDGGPCLASRRDGPCPGPHPCPCLQRDKARMAKFKQGMWEGAILIAGMLLGMWLLANHVTVWPLPGF